MTGQISIQEELKSALDFERTGHDYYASVAEKVKNPLTKEVFSALAGQELVHMERIQEIFDNLKAEGVQPHVHAEGIEQMVQRILKQFTTHERDAWEMDNAEAYEYAQDLERQGIAMYNRLAEESLGSVEKQFFKALSEEEFFHLTALQNVYFYLERTGDWFGSEEGRVWNWMNT